MNIKPSIAKNGLKNSISIPADKSISHRAAILSMLTGNNNCVIKNYSKGADCHSTLNIIRSLGCDITFQTEQNIIIDSRNAMLPPKSALNCGNSGTTMRLMAGILAGANFNSTLVGDKSLSKRPMKRIIEPLIKMGADIRTFDNTAPLGIVGKKLHGITYKTDLKSAQVKSAVLLAGLNAEGETTYIEKSQSRNHTELMLEYLGADIVSNENLTTIKPSKLEAKEIDICGDISSAAFFMVAAAIIPESEITLKNVGINPTRTGIIDVMKDMGADIKITNIFKTGAEPVADITVRYSSLKATTVEGDIIPRLIDEIPIIALLSTQAEGTTVIKDAADLKNKETTIIKAIAETFNELGADIKATSDGLIINGKTNLTGGCSLDTLGDHRIAMTLYIAGMIAKKEIDIANFEWVNISFPEFLELMDKLKK